MFVKFKGLPGMNLQLVKIWEHKIEAQSTSKINFLDQKNFVVNEIG